MKQTNELSTLVAGVVSELVTGVMTGVTSARRHYYRNLVLVAIVVAGITAGITFAITSGFWNHPPAVSVPLAQDDISAPAPTRSQRPEPTPRARGDAEELRKQTRPNPM